MPIYEYRCTACGHGLEQLQRISDEVLKECPVCHKPALQKMVSAASFQLKGSGWYVTDFKNKQTPAGNDKKDDKSTKTKTDNTKTDNKKET